MDRALKLRLDARFAGRLTGPIRQRHDETEIRIGPGDVPDVLRTLHDDPSFRFEFLSDLAGVDTGLVMQVVYHLWSYSQQHSFILKCMLDRAKPEIASVESVWKAADWLEREQFDLMGIVFTGHPDLRRIMLPDDWVGNPLRKDYKEQASWHNISTTRENSLEAYVRLDEFKKKAAEAAAAAAPKKDLPQ